MADYPPFINAYGLIHKILAKIKDAKTPPRFTIDFLGTGLGFTGGSARPFIPFAKKLGLLSSDGAPSELYNKFRDPNHSKSAMAAAIKHGYSQLYDRNEYAHRLDRKGLEGLIIQATGLDKQSSTLKAILGSFTAVIRFADFEAVGLSDSEPKKEGEVLTAPQGDSEPDELKMNLAYTINLNLPKTDDIAVFNAIFRALRENLLKK